MPSCRICGGADLSVFLDLGRTPLANALLRPEDLTLPEPRFPLELALCKTCSLVQILETVPPEQLFSEYLYFSSFSTTMIAHARTLVSRLIAERELGPDSLVVEIASNDGYLLQWYLAAGIPVLGVEPARNVAAVAMEKGIATEVAFFGSEVGRQIARERQGAAIIHANNVLAHVAELNDVVAGIAALLAPDGVAVVEAPYLKDLVDAVEFDTIYHEHLCYFSLTALERLFRRHGLAIEDVERINIHGGSLRIFAVPAATARPRPAVGELLAAERAWVTDQAFYQRFASQVDELRTDLVGLLRRLRSEGHRICAYGAAAKGSTLLNSFGIDRSLIEYVVDRSSYKQGRYMPGVHLPIFGPERLLADRPDYVLLLTWNFAAEILEQQAEYRRLGGKFIIPVPSPTVV